MRTRKATLALTLAAGVTASLTFGTVLADQGSGLSSAFRGDDSVVICHYDRNTRNRNAGPHTVTINASALAHHLANHVKSEGFNGDDYMGRCGSAPPDDLPEDDELLPE